MYNTSLRSNIYNVQSSQTLVVGQTSCCVAKHLELARYYLSWALKGLYAFPSSSRPARLSISETSKSNETSEICETKPTNKTSEICHALAPSRSQCCPTLQRDSSPSATVFDTFHTSNSKF